jgi:2-phosphosulfolactate phosphatase
MKINVLLSPLNADELYFTGKTVVVLDVLRATTTIIAALKNGAREIIPVESVDFAVKVSGGSSSGQTLLAGERNTKMIEGFVLGNSPLEFSQEAIAGKSIIHYTTNGSKAIVKAKFAENLFIGSFNNVSALAGLLLKLGNDVEILCAGSNGMFCIEDTVCAGWLISKIMEEKEDLILSDAAKASLVLKKHHGKKVLKMLKESEHGRVLIENGFEEDLNVAAKIDSTDIIPVFSQGIITRYDSKKFDNSL